MVAGVLRDGVATGEFEVDDVPGHRAGAAVDGHRRRPLVRPRRAAHPGDDRDVLRRPRRAARARRRLTDAEREPRCLGSPLPRPRRSRAGLRAAPRRVFGATTVVTAPAAAPTGRLHGRRSGSGGASGYSDAVNTAEGHGGSASIASRTTGGTSPGPTCSRRRCARTSRVPGWRSTSAVPTGPAPRGSASRRSARSRSTSTPAGWGPRGCAARRWPCPSRTPPSTPCPPSTSSSTASPRPPHSPRCGGCCARVAGSSCRCRPTPGPGPTSTSPTATTGATPRAGRWPRSSGRASRCSGPPTASPRCSRCSRRSAWPARCRAGGPTGRSDIVELPQLPKPLNSMLLGLSRADRAVLRRRDLPFGSSVFLAATRAG